MTVRDLNEPDEIVNIAASIKNWINKAVPTPTHRNKSVQIGVHYEEAGEMARALGDVTLAEHLEEIAGNYKTEPTSLELNGVDMVELLDSLCDQVVTAIGVAHMFNFDILGALAEVNRSNWSKFVDGQPQFNEKGKIVKPASYSPPQLAQFINRE